MLVQTYYSRKISPKRIDSLLAQGWFRGGPGFQRTSILCMNKMLGSVVEVRFDLRKHQFSKSQKRLLAKNASFRIETGPIRITPDIERLYTATRHRFKGFIHETLEKYFHDPYDISPFHTQQLLVYDGDRLVAASFFDKGYKSLMSVMGLYDPEYRSHSLGMYTMLQEVLYAKQFHMTYYYPGYVVDEFPEFDYKLQIGKPLFLGIHGRWISSYEKVVQHSVAKTISYYTGQLEDYLLEKNWIFYRSIYKYYGIGYQSHPNLSLYKYPFIFVLHIHAGSNALSAVTWDHETFQYRLDTLEIVEDAVLNTNESDEYTNIDTYCPYILKHTEKGLLCNTLEELDELLRNIPAASSAG